MSREKIIKIKKSQNSLTHRVAKTFALSEAKILCKAKKYYEKNLENLVERYSGKYIAILNNEVVDSDKDFSNLAKKVYEKYGYQTIYMPFVDVKKKVFKIPSPRIKI
jgi:hypothetical protein